ncbi:MAG TPA: hypothetical protein VNX68_06235 [Nitrosopumilaceae archaeon]|nr:hypothetical protein [Nitrosopumilaceae archaeon]
MKEILEPDKEPEAERSVATMPLIVAKDGRQKIVGRLIVPAVRKIIYVIRKMGGLLPEFIGVKLFDLEECVILKKQLHVSAIYKTMKI